MGFYFRLGYMLLMGAFALGWLLLCLRLLGTAARPGFINPKMKRS